MFLTDYEEIEKLRAKLQARDQRIAELEGRLRSIAKRYTDAVAQKRTTMDGVAWAMCSDILNLLEIDAAPTDPEARAALEEAHGDD